MFYFFVEYNRQNSCFNDEKKHTFKFVNEKSFMMLNKFSKAVTQDPTQPAAQAMLHAIGMSEEDFKKPLIGIASTGYEGNPCNMHLNELAQDIKIGINSKSII